MTATATRCSAVGIDPDPELDHRATSPSEGGAAATRRLLALPDRPTAIFAESDEMAYGALREIREPGCACRRTSR